MSYVDPSIDLRNNKVSFTCINDKTNVDHLDKDVKHYCIYTFHSTPNFSYLDSVKDKVFIIALVDTSLPNTDIGHIPLKFSTNIYNVEDAVKRPALNNILTKYSKPIYLEKQNPVTESKLKDWFYSNQRILTSSKFDVYSFGSFLGNDLDLLVTKREKVKVKQVSKFLKRLIDSGKRLGITVEPFYCNDINYFNDFYYKDSSVENKPVLMGWYSDIDYPSVGRKIYKDNLCMMYFSWKELFFKSCHKDEAKKLITTYSELDSIEGSVHIAPSIYYSLFNRYANLKKFYGSNI